MKLTSVSSVTGVLSGDLWLAVSPFSLTPVIPISHRDWERLHFPQQALEMSDWKGHIANCHEEMVDLGNIMVPPLWVGVEGPRDG